MTKRKTAEKPADAIECYKGFNAKFQCRGFQFEPGQTYTHDGPVKACQSGFHACESPWDVLRYYELGEGNRYAKVTLSGDLSRDNGSDNKVAGRVLTVGKELSFGELVGAMVAHQIKECVDTDTVASGPYSNLAASGSDSKLAASGYRSKIEIEGENCIAASSGRNARVRASKPAWVSLASYDSDGNCDGFATGQLGTGNLKLNTWYRAERGQLVEADDD